MMTMLARARMDWRAESDQANVLPEGACLVTHLLASLMITSTWLALERRGNRGVGEASSHENVLLPRQPPGRAG